MDFGFITPLFKDPRVMLGAFGTILTGAGLGNIFDEIPQVVKNLFKNQLYKFFVLTVLVWQSGQSILVSVLASVIVWFVFKLLLKREQEEKVAVPSKKK